MNAVALLGVALVAAGGLQVTLDRNDVSVGDHVQLTISAQDARLVEPSLPDLHGIDVYGPSRRHESMFVNGRGTQTTRLIYTLVPKKAGEYTIPGLQIRVDGQPTTSSPITLKVKDLDETEAKAADFFASALVDNTTPYLTQQIVYAVRLFHADRNLSCENLTLPEFNDFLVEDLGKERRFTTERHGRRYGVIEIRKSLYPLRHGSFQLPPSELVCTATQASRGRSPRGVVDSFFSRGRQETKTLQTNTIEIEVKPLPPAPADFSGLVGDVSVRGDVSTPSLAVGSSTTQMLHLETTGNLRGFQVEAPEVQGAKLYDDEPRISFLPRGERLVARMEMSRAIVPIRAGSLATPEFSVVYFDPNTKSYERAMAPSEELLVTPGADSIVPREQSENQDKFLGAPPTSRNGPTQSELPEDSLANGLAANTPNLYLSIPGLPSWCVMLLGFSAPVLMLAARARGPILLWRTRDHDTEPLRDVLQRLDSDRLKPELVSVAIRSVLARVDGDVSFNAPEHVETVLKQNRVPETDVTSTVRWVCWCEASRWSGLSSEPPDSPTALRSLLTRIYRGTQA